MLVSGQFLMLYRQHRAKIVFSLCPSVAAPLRGEHVCGLNCVQHRRRQFLLSVHYASGTKNVIATAAEQAKSAREEYEKSLRQRKITDELKAADALTKSLVDLLIKRGYVFPDNRIEIEYLSRSFF